MPTILEELNQQFAHDNHVRFYAKDNGFIYAEIDNAHAYASIAVQGAHVMEFTPHGHKPVIWLSEQAKFAEGKSIRGGVPVCWPWFGPHPEDPSKPAHGYARTVPWQVVGSAVLEGGGTELMLELPPGNATRAHWPHDTVLQLRIVVAASLQIKLLTRNPGTEEITIGEALHTYFRISDIGDIRIHGLEGRTYVDKTLDMQRQVQQGALSIASETDRVYVDSATDCIIEDPGYQRRIRIAKQDSRSTVVWNPWTEKAAQMGDFGEEGLGWRRMVCVESGNALENCVKIPAGGEHRMVVEYSVEAG